LRFSQVFIFENKSMLVRDNKVDYKTKQLNNVKILFLVGTDFSSDTLKLSTNWEILHLKRNSNTDGESSF